ncbi:hypothetical protein N665_0103s0023 [Sinapis alba]|nr:hypothetical protein N665_0103s0023 [Sinapis alba]
MPPKSLKGEQTGASKRKRKRDQDAFIKTQENSMLRFVKITKSPSPNIADVLRDDGNVIENDTENENKIEDDAETENEIECEDHDEDENENKKDDENENEDVTDNEIEIEMEKEKEN